MAQQYTSWLRSFRWAPVILAAALVACGGGGDAPRNTQADDTVVPLAANASRITPRYAVAETHQGPINAYTRQLNVIDTQSGTVLWHMPLGVTQQDYPGWWVSESFQPLSGRPGVAYGGPQLLYFVQNGQVFQMDISGGVIPPSLQRISAITDACGLGDRFFPADHAGRHAWLVVRTAGADGDCTLTNDNLQVLVSSGMPTYLMGPTAPSTRPVFLSSLPNAQGQPLGMLTIDASLRRIVIRSMDLTQNLQIVPGDVDPEQPLWALAPLPGSITQWLIQIGTQIRVLDLRGSTPSLGPVLTTLPGLTLPLIFNADDKAIYLVNGRNLLAVNGAGAVSTLTTFPAEGGDITSVWLTSNSVLSTQNATTDHTGALVAGQFLWSVNRQTGARQALAQGGLYDDITVLHTENGLVYYTQADGLNELDGRSTNLHKVRDSGRGHEVIARRVMSVDSVLHPLLTPEQVSLQSLVWCEPLPARADCDGGKVVSYDVTTFTRTILGTLPSGANYTAFHVGQQAWTGSKTLVHISQWHETSLDGSTPENLDTTLWLFNASTANSLAGIPLPP